MEIKLQADAFYVPVQFKKTAINKTVWLEFNLAKLFSVKYDCGIRERKHDVYRKQQDEIFFWPKQGEAWFI